MRTLWARSLYNDDRQQRQQNRHFQIYIYTALLRLVRNYFNSCNVGQLTRNYVSENGVEVWKKKGNVISCARSHVNLKFGYTTGEYSVARITVKKCTKIWKRTCGALVGNCVHCFVAFVAVAVFRSAIHKRGISAGYINYKYKWQVK